MKKANVTYVIRGLSWLTVDELLEVNKVLVSTIRHIRSNEKHQAKHQFELGDQVVFNSTHYGRAYGNIEKMNRVNSIVRIQKTDRGNVSGNRFRVPYTMLSLAK
jgi:hypothetical protein